MPDDHSAAPEDVDTEPEASESRGEHEAPEGAPLHPLIDLSRDPNPGEPNHARPDGT